MKTLVRLSLTVLIVIVLLTLGGQAMSKLMQQSDSEDQKVEQLVMVLRDKQLQEREPERVVEAIEQLGRMKSIAAIEDLVKLLTFRRIFEKEKIGDVIVGEHFEDPLKRFPAMGALVKIGKPSLPALVKVIRSKEIGSPASDKAIYTVGQIFRDSLTEGVYYLREAAANASSSEAARRLAIAAEKMNKLMGQ